MYTVIGFPKTRTFRVMWVLAELGQDYELIAASPHKAEINALNPSGKIPALRDGDHTIIDSVAICQYLADKHQKLTFAAGTIERAHQDSFTQFAMDDLEWPLWTHGKNSFVLPENQRVPEIIPQCRSEFARALQTLEQRLGKNQFVMGEKFTVADIMLVHCLNWAGSIGFDTPQGAITEYAARARARPAYKAAWARRDDETKAKPPMTH